MPKSKSVAGGKTVFDGKWGNETVATIHDFQVFAGIDPPGGFEAGRRTLGSLDGRLPKPAAPTPPPAPCTRMSGGLEPSG